MSVDPGVYVDHDGYHLFYTTRFCRRAQDYTFSWDPADPPACDRTITSIGYAFSRDSGLTWEFRHGPVVMPGESGFDATQIETAAAFRLGNTLYLAYSADGEREGRKFTARYQVGVAQLQLGRQSVREVMMDESRQLERRRTPLLAFDLRPGRFDNNVQEPSIAVGPDGPWLYYVALGLHLPEEPLGVAGQRIVSIGLGRAKLDEQLNVTWRSESPVLSGVNTTEVRYFGGAYHLFGSTVSTAHRNEAITYATSPDGVQWTPPRVILSPGSVPGFNDLGLMAPTAAVERNRVVLFYTAFGTVSRACQTVGPAGRFGFPVGDGSRCMFTTTGRAISALPTPGSAQR